MARVSKVTKAPAPLASVEKAPHPADTRRAAVLANPASFTASIRFAGRNNTIPGATLAEAAAWAYGLEAAVTHNGGTTRAIVYALPHDGGGPETVPRPEWLALVPPATRTIIDRNVAHHSARITAARNPKA